MASEILINVYTILCFSEMSLPSADLFPDFIVLTSPHERSADPIPSLLDWVTMYQHPICIIDSQRRGHNYSDSDCVNHIYYLCEI